MKEHSEEIKNQAIIEVSSTPILSPTIENSIEGFNTPLANYLESLGLPTDNVLTPVSERRSLIGALQDALSILPISDRENAYYLSKFTVAIAVGLFDGALNFLWNETISSLRKLIIQIDLLYVLLVLEKLNSKYKGFSSEDDLNGVSDHDLLESCRRIGLLNDISHKKLELINYMRNHASAAHPTDNRVNDAYEMLGWLRTCLKEVISAEIDHSVISVKQLLVNIRTVSIPESDFPAIGSQIAKLSQERIDDFTWTLFGMFTDPRQKELVSLNIEKIGHYAWNSSSVNRRLEIGAKFGLFRVNGEVDRKDLTEKFLSIVGGLAYKDNDSLAGELIEKLESLKSAHFGSNNFYNESPYARDLKRSLPSSGSIPKAAKNMWVKVISICYIGNGRGYKEGVDEQALPYYTDYISKFGEDEISIFLKLFTDTEFSLNLDNLKCDSRTRKLIEQFKAKEKNIFILRCLQILIKAPIGKLEQVARHAEYERELQQIQ
jgi:hypothetical protein